MLIITYILTGAVLGFLISFFILKGRYEAIMNIKDQKINEHGAEIQSLKAEIEEKIQEILELNKQLSAAQAQIPYLQQKLAEQKAEIENMQEKLTITFKNLANEILEEKSRKFTEQNKTNLDQLLQPLGEKIKEFERKVEEKHKEDIKNNATLAERLKQLIELNQLIGKEAENLTRALKGEAKTQGNWGEMILESILEKSGLQRDREYFIQPTYQSDEGGRLRPDVVVMYPNKRSIIIDSKVSLTAYDRYVAAVTKEEQETALKEHYLSVRKHIDELASKNYQTIGELKTLDFVMLFMPIEPAYLLVMQYDASLWNYAYEKRVLLISPTNLIAALKMIENLWRQENQNRNAEELAKKVGELYDKLTLFVNDLIELGKRLNAAQEYYQSSMKKMSEGRGNIIQRAEEIKQLGAKTTKNLPDALINRALGDNE